MAQRSEGLCGRGEMKTLKTFKKYFRIWQIMTFASFAISLISRFGALLFLTGKILRFSFFLLLLFLLLGKTKSLIDYNLWQVIFFFLTFNLVDLTAQLFFREVYRFRSMVISGNFDLVLSKPINPLFRILAGGADFLDFLTLIPLVFFIIYAAVKMGGITFVGVFLYLLLYFNAILIAVALHIVVASIGILTTEVDNTIMLYRDLSNMARIPIDVYRQPIRAFLIFLIPVGVMITFPAKALMGFLSPGWITFSFSLGIFSFWLSLRFWHFSLRRYSS